MPFTLATKEVGFAKGSFFGPGGTGKTTLLAMLLIYLSKTYHNSAPVAWLASEKGVDFIIDIFKAEGVPLLLQRTRSFLDLRAAGREALREGACGIGIDSITHFWQELFEEGMNGKNATGPRLQRIGKIKAEWAPFTQDFQDLPIHFLVSGRMGFVWDEVELPDDKGVLQKEISKSGTKIKAEGDFGHEPDLAVETAQMEDPDFVRYEKVRGRARKTFKSQMLHVATVKKCRVWALNGQAFTWKDQPAYKLGYYATVAKSFEPYFKAINIGGAHHVEDTTRPKSDVLFEHGSSESFYQDRQVRVGLLEEISALLDQCFPGGEKRSKQDAMYRNLTLEQLNGFMSWSRMEEELSALQLERNVLVLQKMRKRITAGETVTNQQSLAALVHLAEEDLDHPAHGMSLLEVMTAYSLESVNGKRGPQPVVQAMDRGAEEAFGD